ncbi:hypothetical protein PHJA_001044800 [Phtheirospermum japonicum]|uniref:Eukaryotic translation initiation factor 4B3-like n=1 Tax=Phtheirospermum japonicum TaxID=374723 RepID=A0A830C3Z7_9LAMI|nr:hypothetical protein PHJA_001044800 [Phtheirospermum japonicum]
MAATVSAWAKPGAWALDAEENETELLKQRNEDAAVNNGHSNGAETADFPSLSAAAATKTKKKKKQSISLAEFSTYGEPKPVVAQSKSLTPDELLALPTGPRERSAEELDRNRLGGGFRSYGGGRDEQPRRQGGFNRESNREFTSSKADETDDWAKGKKSPVGGGFERRERGERGSFFTDSQSRADEVDNWASKKSFVPSEPRRYEKRGGFGLESSNGGADADNWVKKKEDEGRKAGSAFDSLRERRGGSDVDSESWGRKREDASVGGGRPKLNLQPRSLPVVEVQPKVVEVQHKVVEVTSVVVNKPKASNPFGEARPREEVLKEKGQDWKEIEEKLESVKVKDSAWADAAKRGFWGANGKDRPRVEEKTDNAWRKPRPVDSRPESAGGSENGSAVVNSENGNGHAEEAEERDTQI